MLFFATDFAVGYFSPVQTVSPNKFCITKIADCFLSVFFQTGPEITAAEPAEYGWAPGVKSLPLKGIIKCFN